MPLKYSEIERQMVLPMRLCDRPSSWHLRLGFLAESASIIVRDEGCCTFSLWRQLFLALVDLIHQLSFECVQLFTSCWKKNGKTRQSHRWEPNSLYFVQSKQSKRKTPQSCSWIKPWASHVPTSPSVTRLNERNQQTTKLKCPCLLCFSYRRRNKNSSSGKENRTSPIHLRGSHSSTLPQWRRCKTR